VGWGKLVAVKLEHGLPCRQRLKLLVNILLIYITAYKRTRSCSRQHKVQVRAFLMVRSVLLTNVSLCGLWPSTKWVGKVPKALTYHANKVHNGGVIVKRYDDVKELYRALLPSFRASKQAKDPIRCSNPKKTKSKKSCVG
jgi:hypothetical protein